MKNEIMMRAIGEIDEDLVAGAYAAGTKKRRRALRPMLASAACALLLVGALLAYRAGSPGMAVGGTPLGSDPVAIDTPAMMSLYDPAPRALAAITVPLELTGGRKQVTLTAESGMLTVFDAETGETVFDGASGSFDCPLRLEWTVAHPTPGETYRLTVGRTALSLAFDEELGIWCVAKE